MKLVLASKSPRRKEILSMLDIPFEIRVSNADETCSNDIPTEDIARILAIKKAQAVAVNAEEVIIGCDTVVISDGVIMGKPRDDREAEKMLRALSGTSHLVISGLCVRTGKREYSESVTTVVKMRELTEGEISAYVNTSHPTDKAGAYGIQEMAGAFVEGIEGDFYNVVGLPLCRLTTILQKEFGLDVFKTGEGVSIK